MWTIGVPLARPGDLRGVRGTVEQTTRSSVPDSELDFAAIWQSTLGTLTDAGLTAQQKAFLRLARFVGLIDSTALLAVPNDYTKEILEQRLLAQVTDALGSELHREVRLAVTVDPALAGNDSEAAVEGAGGASSDDSAPTPDPAVEGQRDEQVDELGDRSEHSWHDSVGKNGSAARARGPVEPSRLNHAKNLRV